MPRMQVTFKDALQPTQRLELDNQLTTLVFQINFRGKDYDCIGHIESISGLTEGDEPVRFSGYCGYNGRIDIQKLSSAAEDYYRSIIERMRPGVNQLINKESDSTPSKTGAFTDSAVTSYEFDVGHVLKQAS